MNEEHLALILWVCFALVVMVATGLLIAWVEH